MADGPLAFAAAVTVAVCLAGDSAVSSIILAIDSACFAFTYCPMLQVSLPTGAMSPRAEISWQCLGMWNPPTCNTASASCFARTSNWRCVITAS